MAALHSFSKVAMLMSESFFTYMHPLPILNFPNCSNASFASSDGRNTYNENAALRGEKPISGASPSWPLAICNGSCQSQ